jgi:hypothetical protein
MAEEVKQTRGGVLGAGWSDGRADGRAGGADGREKGRQEGDSGHQVDRLREEDDQKNDQLDSLYST